MALVVCSTVQKITPDTAVPAQWVVARFEGRYTPHRRRMSAAMHRTMAFV